MKFLFLLLTLLCTACTSISSKRPVDVNENVSGIIYFMPNKDIKITVKHNVDNNGNEKPPTITVTSSDAYPDLAHPYYLNLDYPFLTDNEATINLTVAGLLTKTDSDAKTTISSVLESLASVAAYRNKGLRGTSKNGIFSAHIGTSCTPTKGATYSYLVQIDDVKTNNYEDTVCGFKLSIEKLVTGGAVSKNSNSGIAGDSHSGIFYRYNIPYKVTLSNAKYVYTALAFSPSDSPIQYLPINKSFFGSNKSTYSLKDGVIEGAVFKQSGELTALLKLPADILSEYTKAVGSLFDAFKGNATSEVGYLQELLKLEKEKIKFEKCTEALQAQPKDDAVIEALGC